MKATPNDERAAALADRDTLIEMIERRELMIQCNRQGVLIIDPHGQQWRGANLRQLLESMR